MSHLSIESMQAFLSKSISSLNRNKINGMLAEIDFREKVIQLGFADRVSQGGWIARNTGVNNFSSSINVFFPETIKPNHNYSENIFSEPPRRLHTICSTMHQIGIKSFYCVPFVGTQGVPESVVWYATQLGIPSDDDFHLIGEVITDFEQRQKRYNFLRYHEDTQAIPLIQIPEEFTKENLRVNFQEKFLSEISDIDGIIWGEQYTYPIEIKEKTAAFDKKLGPYFGIDVGPFVKLAFYAAKRGNLHSLFIVREIDNTNDRNLLKWWFITFDRLAQFASWVFVGGGTNMSGGRSSVVRIPKDAFIELTLESFNSL